MYYFLTVPSFSLRFFTCFFTLTLRFSAFASCTSFLRAFLLSGDSSRGRAEFLNFDDFSSPDVSSSSSSSDTSTFSFAVCDSVASFKISGCSRTFNSAFSPVILPYIRFCFSPFLALSTSRSK